jgi:hypothetical protein
MGIVTKKIEVHWNYLLAIEKDIDRLSRYVDFADDNFATYSIELARLLLTSAAEVDVVCKQICRNLDPTSTAHNVNQYRSELRKAYPTLHAFEVTMPRYGLQLRPWDEWKTAKGVPFWWTAYNKIKHHRNVEYKRANLKNTLNAFAGLFVVTLYLYKAKAELGELVPNPQLLRVGPDHFAGTTHDGHEFGTNYSL